MLSFDELFECLVLLFDELFEPYYSPPMFLFRPNIYRGTCMSIEHIYMGPWSLATLKTVTCDPKIPGHLRP